MLWLKIVPLHWFSTSHNCCCTESHSVSLQCNNRFLHSKCPLMQNLLVKNIVEYGHEWFLNVVSPYQNVWCVQIGLWNCFVKWPSCTTKDNKGELFTCGNANNSYAYIAWIYFYLHLGPLYLFKKNFNWKHFHMWRVPCNNKAKSKGCCVSFVIVCSLNNNLQEKRHMHYLHVNRNHWIIIDHKVIYMIFYYHYEWSMVQYNYTGVT